MRVFFLCAFSVLALTVSAQRDPALRSRGKLPYFITGTPEQRLQARIAELASFGITLSPEEQSSVLGSFHYGKINAAINGGTLLVNDTISAYVSRILDRLLQDDPLLRKQLHVCISYDDSTSAYAYINGTGIMVVNLELIAMVQSEAELASILCHEIIHYKQRHSYLCYMYDETAAGNIFKDFNAMVIAQELEADSLGFLLFAGSGYKLSAGCSIHERMNIRDFLQPTFRPSFFEHGDYRFPEAYKHAVITEVKEDTVEIDYPSLRRRIALYRRLLAQTGNGGADFLVSEEAFIYLNRTARREYCQLYLAQGEFISAIYLAYALLQDNPSDTAMQRVIGAGLYGLAVDCIPVSPVEAPAMTIFSTGRRSYIISTDFYEEKPEGAEYWTFVAGEKQRMYFFFEHMRPGEIATLAFDWNWSVLEQSGFSDPVALKRCHYLIALLERYTEFSADSLSPERFSFTAPANGPEKQNTFYPQKREDHKLIDIILDYTPDHSVVHGSRVYPAYCYFAFASCYNHPQFKALLQMPRPQLPDRFPNNLLYQSWEQEESAYGMGINAVALGTYSFYYMDEFGRTDEFEENYEADERPELRQIIMAAGQTKEVNLTSLDPAQMDSSDINDYVTFCMLQQWMRERSLYETNPLCFSLAYDSALTDTLVKRLGTAHVMNTKVMVSHRNRLFGKYNSQYETSLFDLRTGKMILFYFEMQSRDMTSERMGEYYRAVFGKIGAKPR